MYRNHLKNDSVIHFVHTYMLVCVNECETARTRGGGRGERLDSSISPIGMGTPRKGQTTISTHITNQTRT